MEFKGMAFLGVLALALIAVFYFTIPKRKPVSKQTNEPNSEPEKDETEQLKEPEEDEVTEVAKAEHIEQVSEPEPSGIVQTSDLYVWDRNAN